MQTYIVTINIIALAYYYTYTKVGPLSILNLKSQRKTKKNNFN